MAKSNDTIVAHIYETYDYNKFTVLPENRGRKESDGLKRSKIADLQSKVEKGEYIEEIGRVQVNKDFHIINGRHNFELRKNNKMPIRYEIITHPAFNDVPKKEYISSIYNINSVNTAWSSFEMFRAAVQIKLPLALIMEEIMEKYENTFEWLDLAALLLKEPTLFSGRWRSLSMTMFRDKELISQIKSPEFEYELKWFVKLNVKARIAHRKKVVLRCVYAILFNARTIIDPTAFRKSVLTIPDSSIESQRTATEKSCTKMLIDHYNKANGQSITPATILFQIKQKPESAEQPVLSL